ncbi:MAG: hypothetical protein MK078_03500 [Crocinitomicaceae bacterium]|nr:hypothetical protein [Crocinitomicaceae bacterium]
MKRTITLLGILFFFIPTHAQNTTKDASKNVKKITSKEFLEHPQIVHDFFSLDEDLFNKKDFHYNRSALETLVKSNNLSSKKGWSNYIVSADHSYIIFENMENLAIIEFKIFNKGGQKIGFLNQISKFEQKFDYLVFKEDELVWQLGNNLPTPNNADFFKDQNESDMAIVDEFGVSYAFISPESNEVEFAFLDYETKKKSKGKYLREADYKYALVWDDNNFWLEKERVRK